MALTETRPDTAPIAGETDDGGVQRSQPTVVENVLGSGDHKTIGRIFIGASLLFVATDLVIAALVNIHAGSGGDLLEASIANRLLLNHPLALMLCGAMPLLLGLAIYLVPLQIGSPTIAFPRAAALSLWTWLSATALFSLALVVKGSYGGSSEKMTRLGHVSVGLLCVSLLIGVVCVMVTVLSLRTAGMTIGNVPFFSFSMLATGAVWLVTLPAVLALITVWQIRRPSPSDLEAGAYPAIEWLFHQPSVFMVAIPLLGLLADACSSLSGGRQKGYGAIQAMIGAFAALSFGAWAQSGDSRETIIWAVSAIVIAIPVIAVLGGSLDTLRQGKLAASGGLALIVSSILLLELAVLAGAVQAISWAGDGTLFNVAAGGFAGTGSGAGIVIGQFYLVIAAAVLGGLGATFHWGSRLWAGGLPSPIGLLLAPLGLLGGLAFGLGHIIMGLATPDADVSETLALVSGIGGIVLAVTVLGGFAAVLMGAAGRNSNANTLANAPESTGGTFEWLTASPPAAGNFAGDLPGVESPYPVLDRNEGASR